MVISFVGHHGASGDGCGVTGGDADDGGDCGGGNRGCGDGGCGGGVDGDGAGDDCGGNGGFDNGDNDDNYDLDNEGNNIQKQSINSRCCDNWGPTFISARASKRIPDIKL